MKTRYFRLRMVGEDEDDIFRSESPEAMAASPPGGGRTRQGIGMQLVRHVIGVGGVSIIFLNFSFKCVY